MSYRYQYKNDTYQSLIPQDDDTCYYCERFIGSKNLHRHHLIPGYAGRKQSDVHRLTVDLCPVCHDLIHNDPDLMLWFKQFAQRTWEREKGTREEWISIFGKSWLEE
jgi:hypothetical protein